MKKISEIFKSTKATYVLLLVCGLIGFTASTVLTYEKLELLKNPTYVPACSINPIVTCTSAMSSAESEVMGVPFSIIGLIAYTALITVSVLLIAGVKLPRRIWALIVAVALGGLAAIHYLVIVSIFFLHTICPWCFTLWISVPLIFLGACIGYTTNVQSKKSSRLFGIISFVSANATIIAVVWYSLLVIALLSVFWDFWISLIP